MTATLALLCVFLSTAGCHSEDRTVHEVTNYGELAPPMTPLPSAPLPNDTPTSLPRLVFYKGTPPPSFFPARPSGANLRYRTGVLIGFGAGMKSGGAVIRDAAGSEVTFFTGRSMYIDGKQTHCAIPPLNGHPYDPVLCDGGWPADVIVGQTKVRVYYWHDATPWGQQVLVTDEIDRAP